MAEDLIMGGAGELLNRLISYGLDEIGLVWGVKGEIEKLKGVLARIQAVLQDAETRQLEDRKESDSESVRLWLKELKLVAYDADDILDEIAYQTIESKIMGSNNKVLNFFSKSNSIFSRADIAHRIQGINDKLDAIERDKERFKFHEVAVLTKTILSSRSSTSSSGDLETGSMVDESGIVGRGDDVFKLVNLLVHHKDGNGGDAVSSVVPIVGFGGLGKTTLARLVYNAKELGSHFDLKMWICVSRDFNVKRVLREMMDYFTFETARHHDSLSMDSIQRALEEKLRARRFLLVLDNLWMEDMFEEKWEALAVVLKHANQGSKMIVTTRSSEVARTVLIGSSYIHNLKTLPPKDCWELFERRAFGSGGGVTRTPALEAIGWEIVRKCGGVPLAVKALGGMMRLKRDENDWLAMKTNDIWNMPDSDEKIMKVLKLSFDNLSSPVKGCFSYCSIFPRGHTFSRKKLIQLWMAEGFVTTSEANSRALEDVGNRYFSMLYFNSFFHDVETNIFKEIKRCKMHDLVYDLAQFVSGNEGSIANADLIPKDISAVRYMGFISGGRATEFSKALYKASKLRTFFSCNRNEVPRDLFMNLKSLRALDLSRTWIKELPSSIRNLKHLRYLDLSTTEIEELPKSITCLYNLQTLRLKKCKKLKVLPKKLWKLINLRHLHIDSYNDWIGMPKGIGRLTCLQVLKTFKVGIEEDGNSIAELQHMNLLRGRVNILGLENVKNVKYAKNANLKGKDNISSLGLAWRKEDDGIANVNADNLALLEALEPSRNLKQLAIEGFAGVNMPTWIRNVSTINNLIQINLRHCHGFEHLPSFGQLPFLSTIFFVEMRNVKRFGDCGSNKSKEVAYPSLETLVFRQMPNFEEWLLEEAMWSHSFPCLIELFIEHCPKLKATPQSPFPSLKRLQYKGHSNSAGIRSIASNLAFLTFLRIEGSSDLKFLPQHFLEKNKLLNTLGIVNCPEFEGFLEGEHKHGNEEESNVSSTANRSRVLPDLQMLEIGGCPQFKDTTMSLPSLKTLTIMNSNATFVELFTRNLTSLTHLGLDMIQDLLYLPRNVLRNSKYLERLLITNCPLVHCGGVFCAGNNEDLPVNYPLETLVLSGCHLLNSINVPLPRMSSLVRVEIENCKGLESFPEGLSLLPHLQALRIGQFCEDLDYFPFPDLEEPQIQFSADDQQRRHFTSLATLVLIGWPKLKSLPHQLQYLTKLKALRVQEFGGLVALPSWFGGLASLHSLSICSCENIMYLPSKEVMQQLTLLEELEFKDCPLLKSRCKQDKGDGEWSKISHVPTIIIN